MKLKLKMSMKILATIKKCLTLGIIQLCQNINDNSNKLVVGKMKDEFVGLKPKMYSYLVNDDSIKKQKV